MFRLEAIGTLFRFQVIESIFVLFFLVNCSYGMYTYLIKLYVGANHFIHKNSILIILGALRCGI
jgi:hypothetical protein